MGYIDTTQYYKKSILHNTTIGPYYKTIIYYYSILQFSKCVNTSQYFIITTSILQWYCQYYINTTSILHLVNSILLNTTNQHFNTTSILHCILCNSILPNTTNTTKVQYYISINTTQYYQYYQYYKGQLADGRSPQNEQGICPPLPTLTEDLLEIGNFVIM